MSVGLGRPRALPKGVSSETYCCDVVRLRRKETIRNRIDSFYNEIGWLCGLPTLSGDEALIINESLWDEANAVLRRRPRPSPADSALSPWRLMAMSLFRVLTMRRRRKVIELSREWPCCIEETYPDSFADSFSPALRRENICQWKNFKK